MDDIAHLSNTERLDYQILADRLLSAGFVRVGNTVQSGITQIEDWFNTEGLRITIDFSHLRQPRTPLDTGVAQDAAFYV